MAVKKSRRRLVLVDLDGTALASGGGINDPLMVGVASNLPKQRDQVEILAFTQGSHVVSTKRISDLVAQDTDIPEENLYRATSGGVSVLLSKRLGQKVVASTPVDAMLEIDVGASLGGERDARAFGIGAKQAFRRKNRESHDLKQIAAYNRIVNNEKLRILAKLEPDLLSSSTWVDKDGQPNINSLVSLYGRYGLKLSELSQDRATLTKQFAALAKAYEQDKQAFLTQDDADKFQLPDVFGSKGSMIPVTLIAFNLLTDAIIRKAEKNKQLEYILEQAHGTKKVPDYLDLYDDSPRNMAEFTEVLANERYRDLSASLFHTTKPARGRAPQPDILSPLSFRILTANEVDNGTYPKRWSTENYEAFVAGIQTSPPSAEQAKKDELRSHADRLATTARIIPLVDYAFSADYTAHERRALGFTVGEGDTKPRPLQQDERAQFIKSARFSRAVKNVILQRKVAELDNKNLGLGIWQHADDSLQDLAQLEAYVKDARKGPIELFEVGADQHLTPLAMLSHQQGQASPAYREAANTISSASLEQVREKFDKAQQMSGITQAVYCIHWEIELMLAKQAKGQVKPGCSAKLTALLALQQALVTAKDEEAAFKVLNRALEKGSQYDAIRLNVVKGSIDNTLRERMKRAIRTTVRGAIGKESDDMLAGLEKVRNEWLKQSAQQVAREDARPEQKSTTSSMGQMTLALGGSKSQGQGANSQVTAAAVQQPKDDSARVSSQERVKPENDSNKVLENGSTNTSSSSSNLSKEETALLQSDAGDVPLFSDAQDKTQQSQQQKETPESPEANQALPAAARPGMRGGSM